MGFVIGFGSIEGDREEAEEEVIRDYVADRYDATESYFTDAFIDGIRTWLDDRAKKLRAEDASYKSADNYPDRYGSYYPTVVADASHIVVIQRWLHTNRRHGMSPDGWAAMCNKRVFCIDKWDDLDSHLPAEPAVTGASR